MKRHYTIAIAPLFATAVASFSREAAAQWSDCNAGANYPGVCYEGESQNGYIVADFVSNSGVAVYADDRGTGIGVQGEASSSGGNGGFFSSPGTGTNSNSGYGGALVANATSSGGTGIFSLSTNGFGLYGEDTGDGDGVKGTSSTGYGVYGTGGNGVVGSSSNGSGSSVVLSDDGRDGCDRSWRRDECEARHRASA